MLIWLEHREECLKVLPPVLLVSALREFEQECSAEAAIEVSLTPAPAQWALALRAEDPGREASEGGLAEMRTWLGKQDVLIPRRDKHVLCYSEL